MPPSFIILMTAMAVAPPKSSNTMETVVLVGKPKELKMSRIMTSVQTTAKKTHITSAYVKFCGCKMPWRAMSIIPLLVAVPTRMPTAAIISTVLKRAALEPTADERKLTASFETPTNMSKMARQSRNAITKR